MDDVGVVRVDDLSLEEAEVMPFEPAGFDWKSINEIQQHNPTKGHAVVPDAMVDSCSECCMSEINGRPNVIGIMWRKFMTNPRTGHLDCGRCPITSASTKIQARDGQGKLMYQTLSDGTKVPLMEDNVVKMEIDGTA